MLADYPPYPPELLPCPFCGGEALLLSDIWSAQCSDCHASKHGDTWREAVAAWNRRADSWTACYERLPEEGVDVLAFVDSERVEMMYYRGGEGWLVRRGHRVGLGDYSEVTHWMPLPLPPK